MNTISLCCASLLAISLASIEAAEPLQTKEPADAPSPAATAIGPKPVRLKFVPEGGAWKGETAFDGASWTNLGPGLTKGTLFLHAKAGVGHKFPVQEKDGVTLFEVRVVEGSDERVVVEVQSKDGVKKVDLSRDQRAQVEVGGLTYELRYASVSVDPAKDANPSTNKATFFITRRL